MAGIQKAGLIVSPAFYIEVLGVSAVGQLLAKSATNTVIEAWFIPLDGILIRFTVVHKERKPRIIGFPLFLTVCKTVLISKEWNKNGPSND